MPMCIERGSWEEEAFTPCSSLCWVMIPVFSAFVVAQQDPIAVTADDTVDLQRNLAATPGRVDHVSWHCVPGRVAAQPFDDLQTLGHRRAEVRRAADRIALV